ncbi:MAG TPA: transporter suffix domain-containing protein [Terrimicrobiaceae bacterium]
MTTKAEESPNDMPVLVKDWRFYLGMTALGLSIILPVFAIFVPFLGLSVAQSALVAGLLIAGGPEVMALVAVALLGKQTFRYLLHRIKSFFRAKLLEQPVSKARYFSGLAVSIASWIPLYLYGYLPAIMPGENMRIYILAAADLSFVASMFVMGGEFWEKVRKIFIWEGKPSA